MIDVIIEFTKLMLFTTVASVIGILVAVAFGVFNEPNDGFTENETDTPVWHKPVNKIV